LILQASICYAVEVYQASISFWQRFLLTLFALIFSVAAASAGPFSNLVVFGDSLSDVGNIAQAPFINTPGPYYWNGRFSNGPVYAESLATGLGLPALTRSTAGGNDFAYGGAQTTGTGFPENLFVRDIDDQVSQFLSSRTANATTLYLLFAGANDLLGGQTNMNVPVSSLAGSINQLVAAGARQFLVLNLPLLGHTPRYNGSPGTLATYNARSAQFNSALSSMLDGLAGSNPALTIHRFDVASLISQAIASPAAFGLTNVTHPAAPGLQPGATSYNTSQIVPNPNQYMFWDDLHPTTAVHAILASRVLDLFRLPGDFNRNNTVDAADYVTWRKNAGATYIPNDYDIWRSHFAVSGSAVGAGESLNTALPEPSGAAIFFLLITATICVRRPSKCWAKHTRLAIIAS
jgi:phospholipase/lecithinase/hemolysin